MAHWLVQATIEELEAATKQVYNPVTFEWEQAWAVHGEDLWIGQYTSGQANISGPLMVGNPNVPYYEVTVSDPAVLDELGGTYEPMSISVRRPGHLRGAYKASIASPRNSRSLIRNSDGDVVGVTPNFMICGTNPAASFLAGEDVDEAEVLTGLE